MEPIFAALKRIGWQKRISLYLSLLQTVCMPARDRRPHASIIVISNRTHQNTATCLSVLRRARDSEIIFVNNGGSAGITEYFPGITKYIATRADYGAYLPRNIGAALAKGKYLIFVDDDGIPHRDMVAELLRAHETYDIVSCQGCCKPLTTSTWNYLAHHYYFGPRPFPYWTNLEGCCCIDAHTFYAAGGWDDRLRFGGGGYDLSIRMLDIEPDKRKYAYIPGAILFHDYVRDAKHLADKTKKQTAATWARYKKNPHYFAARDAWLWMAGREDLLLRRNVKG